MGRKEQKKPAYIPEWNEFNDSLRRGIELAYGGIPPYFVQKKKQSKNAKESNKNQDEEYCDTAAEDGYYGPVYDEPYGN